MKIVQACTPAQFDAAQALFREYAATLDFNLCFQSFEAELSALPTMYGPPSGCLLLAFEDTTPVGCVGLRNAGDGACEMKRLYVRPAARGTGLGRRLAEAVVDEARRLGYQRMILDTLETMQAARSLYASLGFVVTTPYYHNPLRGVVYMTRDLGAQVAGIASSVTSFGEQT